MSRLHAILIVIIFALLTIGAFYGAWYFTLSQFGIPLVTRPTADDWKNFYSLVGVGLAAVGGVMGAWVSFRNVGAQARTATELERVKNVLGKDLERVKKVLEKSIPAYGVLFAAANGYYRALAPLETGNFNLEIIEAAEHGMQQAEGEILYVNDEYENHWRGFWHNARLGKEKANRDAPTVEERKRLWHELTKTLAQDLTEMKKIRQAMLRQ